MPGIDPVSMASDMAAKSAQAIAGGVDLVSGIINTGKANRMDRKNVRPDYEINQEIKDNQAIAESRAGQGLDAGTLEVLEQENERGVSASLDAISKNGGNANHIADVYGNFTGGVNKMALIDEQMRSANVAALIQQNKEMADEKDKEWQLDKYNPWADKAKAAAELRNKASEQISQGANAIIGAVANNAASNQYKNEGASVYGSGATAYRPYAVDANIVRTSQPMTLPPISPDSVAGRFPGLTIGYR